MRSISGFNNSSLDGAFAPGQPISAAALNKLGTGTDIARTMMSNDVQFMANTGGTSYAMPQQVYQIEYANPFAGAPDGTITTVYPGTLNNLTPTIGGVPLTDSPAPQLTLVYSGGTNGYSYVYLVAECSGYTYPVDAPTIQSFGTQQVASDTYGYLLLFTVYKDPTTGLVSMWQYVKSSLWTDRIKIGTSNPAKYYFGSV